MSKSLRVEEAIRLPWRCITGGEIVEAVSTYAIRPATIRLCERANSLESE